MTDPWIEVEQCYNQEFPAVPGSSEYLWQAIFACQVEIPSHQEWARLKWGFNVAALFEEFLERQKIFLESQHGFRRETGLESPDLRTLAFRFISRPGEELLVTVLGKIQARSEAEARESGLSYCSEVKSTLPYDYTLVPAKSSEEYLRLSGMDILEESSKQASFAQIKRIEFPLNPEHKSPFLQGLWQSRPHAHEQIWRSLASSSVPLLLNLSLRSTVLYEKEQERLLKSAAEIARQDASRNPKTLTALQDWNKKYIERHIAPWKKFFYLQIHLMSTGSINEHLLRAIGSSLTLSRENDPLPSYKFVLPKNEEIQAWKRKLKNLDPVFSGSYLPVPRLSEVADLEEVFAVMRLPYSPPDDGFPDVRFNTGKK